MVVEVPTGVEQPRRDTTSGRKEPGGLAADRRVLECRYRLAGLANAEFLGWPGDPRKHPLPHIDAHAVLHLRPDGYRLVPFAVDNDTFWRFLEAKGLWEWLQGQAKTVMGAPLTAPRVEVAA